MVCVFCSLLTSCFILKFSVLSSYVLPALITSCVSVVSDCTTSATFVFVGLPVVNASHFVRRAVCSCVLSLVVPAVS